MEEIASEISNKYAILIDSENVSAKYIESIFDELSRLGSIRLEKYMETGQKIITAGTRIAFCPTLYSQCSSFPIQPEKTQQIRQ